MEAQSGSCYSKVPILYSGVNVPLPPPPHTHSTGRKPSWVALGNPLVRYTPPSAMMTKPCVLDTGTLSQTPILGTQAMAPMGPHRPAHTENQVLGLLARELWGPRLGLSRAPTNNATEPWLQKGSLQECWAPGYGHQGICGGRGRDGHGLSLIHRKDWVQVHLGKEGRGCASGWGQVRLI